MSIVNAELKGGELKEAFDELRDFERLSALLALDRISRFNTWVFRCSNAELNTARMFSRRVLTMIEEELERRSRPARGKRRRPAEAAPSKAA